MPGFLPFGEVEGGFDLVEGEPFELDDFVFLLFGDLGWILGAGEEEDDGFDDAQARDVIRESIAGGCVEENVQAGFFFDLAEGSFDFGFAGFDVAFGKAGEAVVLVNDEDFVVVNNDGAAGSFRSGVVWNVGGGMCRGKIGDVWVGRGLRVVDVWDLRVIHGGIIYYSVEVW